MRRGELRGRIWFLAAVLLAVGCLSIAHGQSKEKAGSDQLVSYEVLEDEMGSVIHIGVPFEINEAQLRAMLVKAANDHQDDPARDYIGLYLTVEAYLVQNGRPSTTPAGRLKRYVPLKNPQERRNMHIDRGKHDKFTITLSAARASTSK